MKRVYPAPANLGYRIGGRDYYRLFPKRRIGKRRDKFRFDLWEAKQIYWETIRFMTDCVAAARANAA